MTRKVCGECVYDTGMTVAVQETASVAALPRRALVTLITPGWGSSGYYSPTVLENAARDRVFPAGTHMYLDHPDEIEQSVRPERTVRDFAGVLTEDARWTGTGLEAAVEFNEAAAAFVLDPVNAANLGVSIRAIAEVTEGEAEGRKGNMIVRLAAAESVDVVTRAGRGGHIATILESETAPPDRSPAPTHNPSQHLTERTTPMVEVPEDRNQVLAAETRAVAAETELAALRDQLAAQAREFRARDMMRATGTHWTQLEEAGLLTGLPVREDGTLNEEAFQTRLDEAAAEKTPTEPVRGFGASTPTATITEADVNAAVAAAFGRRIGA